MCGITGFLCRSGLTADTLEHRVIAMTTTLAHRGPDGAGCWVNPEAGIALGHRRLSVVELSAAGAQPMLSSDERWVINYNGELYNTDEVRSAIENSGRNINWRGHSDTEVIVEAVSLWGVTDTIKKMNGMFAIAFWDRKERQLWLVRDRLGIKPLVWSRLPDSTFVFASDLRALKSCPGFVPRIDSRAVAAYMRHAYVPAPLTIYQGVYKLPPAHILNVSQNGEPVISPYWDLLKIAAEGQRHIDDRPEVELADDLETLLHDSVARQMVSDVPLGAFLSGGVDSSTVVALMQAQSAGRVHTFSIGSQDDNYNEAHHALRVAEHLQTEHTELIVEPEMARAVVDRLPDIYDEPFADSSQIPTFLISELARKHVTVALSGDGGDECFGGYLRYQWISQLERFGNIMPQFLSRGLSFALQSLSPDTWDTLSSPIPRRIRPTHFGDKIHKLAALLPLTGLEQMYRRVIAQWPEPDKIVPNTAEPSGPWDDPDLATAIPTSVSRLRYLDMRQYLPDDILTKVDRSSMAVSLEARVPLLDHRVVEFSWRLPQSALRRGTRGKHILRTVLDRYVPRGLVDRPKTGFAVPIGQWIREPLSDWAADLLSPRALATSGLLNANFIAQRYEEHRTGRRDWAHALWTILIFQAWHRRWIS